MFDLDLSWFLLAFYLPTMASYVLGLVAHEFGHAGMDGALLWPEKGAACRKKLAFPEPRSQKVTC
jgi:hypothetical protein